MTSATDGIEVNNKKSLRLSQAKTLACVALAVALHMSLTLSWVFLIAGIIISLFTPDLPGRLRTLARAPLAAPLLIFAIVVAISTLVNGGLHDFGQIFSNLRSFVVYFFIYQAFFSGSSNSSGSSEKWRCETVTLATFLSVGALAGLYGAVQQLFNFHPGTFRYLQGTGFLQAPMPFAGLMQLTSFLALGLYLKQSYKSLPGLLASKNLFLIVVAANFIGLIFACERSAWLGMAAGLVVMTLRVSPRAFLKVSLVALALFAFGWFFVPAVKARLAPLAHPETDVSVSARVKIWKRAIDTFETHPILGVGPSHFPSITDIPEALVPGRSKDLNHAHSNYLQILSTLGVVGILAFLYLTFCALLVSLKQSQVAEFDGGVGLGLFAALVSLMVAGIFEFNFGTGQVRLAQWFVLGALNRGRKGLE